MESDPEHAETDAAIVQEVLGGRIDAFGLLVERYESKMTALIARRVPRQDVSNVAQEAFVAAYQSLVRLEKKDRFAAWLFRIAARECCNYWRRRESEGRYRDYEVDADEVAEASSPTNRQGDVALVKKLLSRLDAEDRMLVTFLFFEEMSLSEAAKALDWSYIKTKVRYFRAKKKMKVILKKLEGS